MAKSAKNDEQPEAISVGLERFLAYLRDMEQRRNMAIADEKEANDETQDILHGIEFGTVTQTPKALVRMLEGVRTKRRRAKLYMDVSEDLVTWYKDNKAIIGELQHILGAMRKIESNYPKKMYVNRTSILGDK